MILRPAEAGDVAAVHALEEHLFGPDAWSSGSVRQELLGPRRVAVVAVVACDRELVVGYAVTASVGDVVDLERVAVHPGHRRQGLARRLLAAALERAGGDRVLLEVRADNEAALALYAAEGFTVIDRRPRYYRDGSDAVVMERSRPGARMQP